jgi:hypothetical protein
MNRPKAKRPYVAQPTTNAFSLLTCTSKFGTDMDISSQKCQATNGLPVNPARAAMQMDHGI